MLLSKSCEYAIQAILYLAKHHDRNYVSIKEIARDQNVSFYFLTKILQILTNSGLLISYKGPKGGVSLARPADEITLLQVIKAIDGLDFKDKCIIGLPKCDDKNPCPLHNDWSALRDKIYRMLEEKNITELIS